MQQQPPVKTRTQSIQELVVRIGDSQNPPLEKCIESLSGALIKELVKHKDFILDIIFKCVLALPTKTGIYATLGTLIILSLLFFYRKKYKNKVDNNSNKKIY